MIKLKHKKYGVKKENKEISHYLGNKFIKMDYTFSFEDAGVYNKIKKFLNSQENLAKIEKYEELSFYLQLGQIGDGLIVLDDRGFDESISITHNINKETRKGLEKILGVKIK